MIADALPSETTIHFTRRYDDVTPSGALLGDGTQNLEARIAELSDLREDWDGYGAQPIDRQALIFAAKVVRESTRVGWPAPELFPVPDGGVQLEWTAGSMELELEIEPSGQRAVFVADDLRHNRRFDGELPRDMALFQQAMSTLGVRLRERDN